MTFSPEQLGSLDQMHEELSPSQPLPPTVFDRIVETLQGSLVTLEDISELIASTQGYNDTVPSSIRLIDYEVS